MSQALLSRAFSKRHLPFAIVVLTAFVLLLVLAPLRSDPAMLPFHDIDESRFHQSLRRMYDGLVLRDLQRLFAFSFYNYGFIFFLLNLLVDLPFLAQGNDTGAIVASRIVCGLFAIGTLGLVYRIAIRKISPLAAAGICLLLILMPGFWFNAVWFHPDWMMTFFVVLAFERLLADAGRLGRPFWWAAVAFAVAVSVKQQALYYAPGFLIPLVVLANRNRGPHPLIVLAKASAVVLGIFIATNPYLIHPAGRRQWLKMTMENMESNRSNHFSGEKVSLAEKLIDAVQASFLPLPILLAMLAGGLYFAFKTRREPAGSVWVGLTVATLISVVYLLFGVNKAWQHYYLPSVVLIVVSAIPALKALRASAATSVVAGVLVLQIVAYGMGFRGTSVYVRWIETSPERVAAESGMRFVREALAPAIQRDDVVLLSSHTPLDYPGLGIPAKQVRFLDGALRPSHLDREAFAAENPNRPAWSFSRPDFVVMRKPDGIKDSGAPTAEALAAARELLEGDSEFRVLAEDAGVVVYARNEP